MDWLQFPIFILTFVGLFIWNRTESRSDIRHMDAKLDSNRELTRTVHNESRDLMETIRKESKDTIEAIRQDSREFHGRLCALEEKYLNSLRK